MDCLNAVTSWLASTMCVTCPVKYPHASRRVTNSGSDKFMKSSPSECTPVASLPWTQSHMEMRGCSSMFLYYCHLVCLHSWLCCRISVVGVCVCSGLFLWYVITPLTTGLARILQCYQFFVQCEVTKERPFLFTWLPSKRGLGLYVEILN